MFVICIYTLVPQGTKQNVKVFYDHLHGYNTWTKWIKHVTKKYLLDAVLGKY
jgi:hypothetical protein